MRPKKPLPAGSAAAIESGRNTDRSPCAIHLSGKTAATVCIQVGISLNWKKTPEMNCSTRAIGMITAVALLPLRGTPLRAMPRMADVATPSTKTQANVNHLSGSVGSCTPKAMAATPMMSAACSTPVAKTWPILPMK